MPEEFHNYVAGVPGLQLHEWVERLEETLRQTDVAIFPYSVSVGMKTRILQCMACRVVVIGTENAFFGLPFEHKKHVYMVQNLDEMAEGLELLLRSPTLRSQIAQDARDVIETNFTQEIIGAAWERLYANVSRGDNFIT